MSSNLGLAFGLRFGMVKDGVEMGAVAQTWRKRTAKRMVVGVLSPELSGCRKQPRELFAQLPFFSLFLHAMPEQANKQ